MDTTKIRIKETDENDLKHVMDLWNDGEVMCYVGFPNGLHTDLERLNKWLKGVNQSELCRHYSIYTDEHDYCGEAFYSIDSRNDLATLDIKLFPHARGKGIAEYALRHAINQVFENNLATRAYVDPHPDNKAAWKLYNKLGFIGKSRPTHLEPCDIYLELTREVWKQWQLD